MQDSLKGFETLACSSGARAYACVATAAAPNPTAVEDEEKGLNAAQQPRVLESSEG
jgi:hypothetical protein